MIQHLPNAPSIAANPSDLAGDTLHGAEATRRIGIATLDRLRGYAEGGPVGSLPPMLAPPATSSQAAGGGVIMQDNRTIHIGEGASLETVAQLKDALAKDRANRFQDTVNIVAKAKQQRRL